MKSLNLSYFLNNNTPVYGGKQNAFEVIEESSISDGDTANSSKYIFNGHTGTHIDFPLHFSNEAFSSSDFNSDFWIFNNVGFIESSVEDFENKIDQIDSEIEILLFKTNFGNFRGTDAYIFQQPIIPSKWANLLRMKFPKLRLFGFDLISLTSKLDREEGKKAHIQFLLENQILIIEDMNLKDLLFCPKKIIVSPLLIEESDGVPCNVLAIY